jgi:hypothetical protein
MRKPLRDILASNYWVYGLSENDITFTLTMADDLIKARNAILSQDAERIRKEDPERADDILEDYLYYPYLDMQYLWHFCLWRMQAVFEGMICETFLPSKPSKALAGLRQKLDAILAAGYTLQDTEYEELVAWGALRNLLSHAPPEQYRPGPIGREDITEYMGLLKRICAHWRSEEARMNKVQDG